VKDFNVNIKPTDSRRSSMSPGAVIFVIAALFILWLPSGLLGHGVKVDVSLEKPFVVISASYHGGKSLLDAEVTIWFKSADSKDKKDITFQNGKTDRQGRFVFSPHQEGKWVVRVDDLTGHRGKKSFSLDAEFFKKPAEIPAAKTEAVSDTVNDTVNDTVKETVPETATESGTTSTDAGVTPEKSGETNKSDESKSPFSSSQWCCYMLKILLGVVLILLITFAMHRLTKPKA